MPRLTKQRSSKCGDKLTPDELTYITWASSHASDSACPDCQEGALLMGPQACGSINVKCSNCGSKFNLFAFDGVYIGERISDIGGDFSLQQCNLTEGLRTNE